MPKDLRITFIVRSYLHFLDKLFCKSFYDIKKSYLIEIIIGISSDYFYLIRVKYLHSAMWFKVTNNNPL